MDIRKHRFVPKMDTSTKAMKSMKDKERERERRNWNQRLRNGDYDDFDYDDYEEYDESKNLSDRDLSDLVYSILVDEDYSADAMVSEIGELVDADSTGLGAEIYDILTDDELSSEGMVSELEGLVKRVDESHSKDWLGIKGATYIYHGDWADPEIQYDGMSLNYYDVEDGLLAEYREENPDDKNDIGFDDWMAKPSTKSLIQSALDDLVQGGCGTPLDEYDRDEDVIGDYMVEDSSDKARKLGFMGDEKDSDKWLNDKYGQHLNEVYDKIESIVGSEDAEAVYEYWKRIKSQFNCRWGGKTEYEHLDELKKILGQEGKELTDEIEAKWKSDAKSLSDYYSTSHLRGGFTGD